MSSQENNTPTEKSQLPHTIRIKRSFYRLGNSEIPIKKRSRMDWNFGDDLLMIDQPAGFGAHKDETIEVKTTYAASLANQLRELVDVELHGGSPDIIRKWNNNQRFIAADFELK